MTPNVSLINITDTQGLMMRFFYTILVVSIYYISEIVFFPFCININKIVKSDIKNENCFMWAKAELGYIID